MFELGSPGLRSMLGNLQGARQETRATALLPWAFGPEALVPGAAAPLERPALKKMGLRHFS